MVNDNSPMAGIPSHVEMGSLEEHSVIDLEDECLINHGSIDGRTKPPQRYNSVALCLEDSGWEHIWKIVLSRTKGSVFLLSLLGTIPLAERLGWITEQLAFYTGPTVGGLLNATFGNATELIISIHAMKSGLLRVVQQSLLGSILSNMLLVLGSAFFIGGISHSNKQQVFNKANAEMNSGLLLMAVMGLMFPAVLHVTHTELHYGKSELALSRFSSCVMLVAYAAYLFFQLKSQRNLYGTINEVGVIGPLTLS